MDAAVAHRSSAPDDQHLPQARVAGADFTTGGCRNVQPPPLFQPPPPPPAKPAIPAQGVAHQAGGGWGYRQQPGERERASAAAPLQTMQRGGGSGAATLAAMQSPDEQSPHQPSPATDAGYGCGDPAASQRPANSVAASMMAGVTGRRVGFHLGGYEPPVSGAGAGAHEGAQQSGQFAAVGVGMDINRAPRPHPSRPPSPRDGATTCMPDPFLHQPGGGVGQSMSTQQHEWRAHEQRQGQRPQQQGGAHTASEGVARVRKAAGPMAGESAAFFQRPVQATGRVGATPAGGTVTNTLSTVGPQS